MPGKLPIPGEEAMSKKRISRNAPCPCGSGKKYKNCCYGKGFEWVQDEDGTVGKSIPMTEEVTEILQQVRQAFIDKHGREPEPDELLFGDLPHLEHLEAMLVEDMKKPGWTQPSSMLSRRPACSSRKRTST